MNRTIIAVAAVVLIAVAAGTALLATSSKPADKASNPPATTSKTDNSMDMSEHKTPAGGASGSNAVAADSVKIENFAYTPSAITVKTGTKVTWKNDDTTAHTVTADDGSFDSGSMARDAEFGFTFSKAGTYKYHCTFHSNMTGTVTVTD